MLAKDFDDAGKTIFGMLNSIMPTAAMEATMAIINTALVAQFSANLRPGSYDAAMAFFTALHPTDGFQYLNCNAKIHLSVFLYDLHWARDLWPESQYEVFRTRVNGVLCLQLKLRGQGAPPRREPRERRNNRDFRPKKDDVFDHTLHYEDLTE